MSAGQGRIKIKNSERRRYRWLPGLATALVPIALFAPVMLVFSILTLLGGRDTRRTLEDVLVSQSFEDAQAFIVLHERALEADRGSLYLAGWHNRAAIPCLGLIWIGNSERPPGVYRVGRGNAECAATPYSIDQYWGMRSWPRVPFSVAYGFSGDAAQVIVAWQDETITELRPVNGSYLAVNDAKSRVIESVEFYDDSGDLLYRFPESAKSRTARS